MNEIREPPRVSLVCDQGANFLPFLFVVDRHAVAFAHTMPNGTKTEAGSKTCIAPKMHGLCLELRAECQKLYEDIARNRDKRQRHSWLANRAVGNMLYRIIDQSSAKYAGAFLNGRRNRRTLSSDSHSLFCPIF